MGSAQSCKDIAKIKDDEHKQEIDNDKYMRLIFQQKIKNKDIAMKCMTNINKIKELINGEKELLKDWQLDYIQAEFTKITKHHIELCESVLINTTNFQNFKNSSRGRCLEHVMDIVKKDGEKLCKINTVSLLFAFEHIIKLCNEQNETKISTISDKISHVLIKETVIQYVKHTPTHRAVEKSATKVFSGIETAYEYINLCKKIDEVLHEFHRYKLYKHIYNIYEIGEIHDGMAICHQTT